MVFKFNMEIGWFIIIFGVDCVFILKELKKNFVIKSKGGNIYILREYL